MSLRIKIPKQAQPATAQPLAPSRSSKASKRRIDSEDDEAGIRRAPADRSKRAKTEETSLGGGSGMDVDVDADGEPEVGVDIDIEGDADDTRFLPPTVLPTSVSPAPTTKTTTKRASSQVSNQSKSKVGSKGVALGSSKSTGRRSKRTVVWTDDEDEEQGSIDAGQIMAPDDEDFTPEPAPPQPKKGATTSKVKAGKAGAGAKGGKGKIKKEKEEKEFYMKDERKLPPQTVSSTAKEASSSATAHAKRPLHKDDEVDSATHTPSVATTDVQDIATVDSKTKDVTPPPPKKLKLPTIKKNKLPAANSTTPSTPSAPLKPTHTTSEKELDTTTLPPITPGSIAARKLMTPAGNADFDLRDKSVYAQLFSKPAGSTPNSGLNRKEREEERRKELNRLREEARAKRVEEAVSLLYYVYLLFIALSSTYTYTNVALRNTPSTCKLHRRKSNASRRNCVPVSQ
ncbi:hypothetical protein AcW1_006017 [Taiwanofungus camphoratus]|nr:hypothetical protein AcW2_004775 [Antrodia cinnamomea]KAI0957714.1 hypothetical protein AcW1_006017 [Antrodia cinnamomea]